MWPVTNDEDNDECNSYEQNYSANRKTHVDNCNTSVYILQATSLVIHASLLGHLLRDDLINPLKMSVRPSVHTPQSNKMQQQTKINSGVC